jgi:hypothetical protein
MTTGMEERVWKKLDRKPSKTKKKEKEKTKKNQDRKKRGKIQKQKTKQKKKKTQKAPGHIEHSRKNKGVAKTQSPGIWLLSRRWLQAIRSSTNVQNLSQLYFVHWHS